MATMMHDISTSAAFLRPMYCDITPSGNRIRAPAKVGSEIINAACCGVRLYDFVMNGAIAPLSTQTAKQKSK